MYDKFVVRDSVVDFWLWRSYARCTFDLACTAIAGTHSIRASYLLRFAGQNVFLSVIFHFLCDCFHAIRRLQPCSRTAAATPLSVTMLLFSLLQFVLFMSFSNFTFWASWQRFILAILARITNFCMHTIWLSMHSTLSTFLRYVSEPKSESVEANHRLEPTWLQPNSSALGTKSEHEHAHNRSHRIE